MICQNMGESKILTIAIPAYNVEKYIEQCLDSVVKSKFINDLEILVVNDGSTDRTLDIILEYEKKCDSLKLIDKPNGGWGTAINVAVKNAKGKYFKNLDSDDWFDTAELDRFVEELYKTDADIVYSPCTEVCEGKENIIDLKKLIVKNEDLKIDEFLKENGFTGYQIHCLCFKTEMLRNNSFECVHKYYGDLDYIQTPLQYAKTVRLIEPNVYRYRTGREGQSISIEGYSKHFDDFMLVCRKLTLLLEGNKENPVLREVYVNNIHRSIRWLYYIGLSPVYTTEKKETKEKLKEFDKFLKKTSPLLYSLSNKETVRKILPFILIWRKTGINIMNIR